MTSELSGARATRAIVSARSGVTPNIEPHVASQLVEVRCFGSNVLLLELK